MTGGRSVRPRGKSDAKGRPRPLQLAVSVRAYRDVLAVASPSPAVQALLFGPLAAIGRARGLQPSYERHLTSGDVIDPDPRALALLDANGRLRGGALRPKKKPPPASWADGGKVLQRAGELRVGWDKARLPSLAGTGVGFARLPETAAPSAPAPPGSREACDSR